MKEKLSIALVILCLLVGIHQGFFSDDYWWFLDNQIRECIIYGAFSWIATGKLKRILIIIMSLSVIELTDEVLHLNVRTAEAINGITNDKLIVFAACVFIAYIVSNKQDK